jgi:Domain of unknown function (DUF4131)
MKKPYRITFRIRRVHLAIVGTIMLAGLGFGLYRVASTPRAGSLDVSRLAPANAAYVAGLVSSTPITTNGFTRFYLTADEAQHQSANGRVQVTLRGDSGLRRGDTVQVIGDLRSARPGRDQFLLDRGVFASLRASTIMRNGEVVYTAPANPGTQAPASSPESDS